MILEKLLALADEWEARAQAQVPGEYLKRGMGNRYFALDNEAAGLMQAAAELRELLHTES